MKLAGLLVAVSVGPGVWHPLTPASPAERAIFVPAFRLATTPVTVEAFERFVAAHPEWQRGRVGNALAEESYLASWATPVAAGAGLRGQAPVTEVSWFAARAFCRAEGGRLPTEAEWEFAAAADESHEDASRDPAFVARLLQWYGAPNSGPLPAVGAGPANVWGVSELHGLVWEWVEDFNASLAGADPKFCGGGASAATGDKADYAAFMRAAMRSALTGRSTTRSLGFRCAWDGAEP